MRKLVLFSLVGLFLTSCSKNDEERFIFEEERILDVETGDEYHLKNMDTMTVVHIDGMTEPITVSSTPFAESEKLEKMMAAYKKKIDERKENLIKKQKEIIKEQRIDRYAEYDNEELMNHYNELHSNDAPFEQQMDVVIELVRREEVLEIDVANLLEVDSSQVDFDLEYTPDETQ
ncbi:MAG: hypothetical protein WD431_18285 [Cyclobacteriaceae bacterium]